MNTTLGHLPASPSSPHEPSEHLPATVFTFRVGPDGTPSFPFVSPACAAVYGFTAEAAMADVRLMHDAIHPADRESFDAAGRGSMQTLSPLRWEGRILAADGREVAVVVSSAPRRVEDGSTEWHGAVVGRDAEERGTPGVADGMPPNSHADALCMLGHDLGAPLTAILGSAEWALEVLEEQRSRTVEDGDASDALVRRSLQVILRQAGRLNDMRRDLVTVATADSDAILARPAAVEVLPSLRAAADLRRPDVDTRVTCPPGLHCWVQGTHLAQMLGNLVSNADRYARSSIRLTAARHEDRVHISVHDDGPGIPPEMTARLFTRFSHVGTTTLAAGAGTGLGLYIVRTLAEANAGSVLHTPTDSGACFTVVLPAAAPPTA